MTVRQLMELVKDLHPSTPVLLPAHDRSFRKATAQVGSAICGPHCGWAEDFGEEEQPLSETERRYTVLIIR